MNRDGSPTPSSPTPCPGALRPSASVRIALAPLVAKALPRKEHLLPCVLGRELGLLLGRDDRRELRPGDERQGREGRVFQVEVLPGGSDA